MSLIDKAIKTLKIKELPLLAEQIRERIIDVMSVNGGHLASSLGAVELTIAMHYVFDSPQDKFVFDVGHQTYPHKILTGRSKEFSTVRQFGGLSGFSHPGESEHDPFFTGHAGTSLSLALGLAKARDLQKRDEHIVSVMGDASLTCGLIYEALNNTPRDLKNFIVILNDNEMSISHNVGCITATLGKMINNPRANRFYHEMGEILAKIPACGERLAERGGKIKRALKNLLSDAGFFEHFHYAYVGPVNGHNVVDLIAVLEAIKEEPRPVILHIKTIKGHGMPKAVANPISYHGVRPFDKVTGLMHQSTQEATFPQIFGKTMLEMAEDPSLVVITPAMPAGSCLTQMMQKHPDRCIDVGIAEGHSLTFAGGIAKDTSLKVMVAIYSTFLQRALDNLYHDIVIQNLPVVLAIDRGGIAGGDGVTHNGIYDIGFLSQMPGMVIAQPRNGSILKALLKDAFNWKRPAAIRYPNLPTKEEDATVFFGKAQILIQGEGICIVALGHMEKIARELIAMTGINATLIDPVFIKPLDRALFLKELKRHHTLITIEEHAIEGGLGSILNRFVLEEKLENLEVINYGIKEEFVHHGSHGKLLELHGLSATKIAKDLARQEVIHLLEEVIV
jgi:1-deoxy-D-xylulose-5-phosphate synthase